MRVLIVAPYFYDANHKEFSTTSSGFGYMVKDILDAISDHDDVFVFTHQFSNGYKENYSVIKHRRCDVATTLRVKDFWRGFLDAIGSKVDISTRLHYLYYQFDKGSFIKTIRTLNPDIVHIHGLTYQTRPFVEGCNEIGQKYIVTLHGLNGLNDTVILPELEKEYEKNELINLCRNNVAVTVISTGILRKIKFEYGINTSNIRVILNGTKFKPQKNIYNRSKKYEIVCIGSISFHKNQTQLIDALNNMPRTYLNRLHITFYGIDSDGIDLDKYIVNKNLQDVAEYKGFVPREEMSRIWERANLNVIMSKEEGFGLSMIEGFMYGVPTATFSDLDAISDIFCEEALYLFESRNNHDVQQGIIECMNRVFDRDKIIEWGNQFSMDHIGEQYSRLYKEISGG